MTKILLLFILVYQKGLSGLLYNQCRFLPTCSQYAKEAITTCGWHRGSVKAIWRLLRCHRWANGGLDPVK